MTDMTSKETRPPDEGSVNICLYCWHIQVFSAATQQWREPTDDEHFEIATDPVVKHLQSLRGKVSQ